MIYDIFLQSPFPWILFAGVFFGMTLSRLTRFIGNAKDPRKARERKAFWVMMGFSLVIALILLGVFVPGPEKIRDINLIYLFGGAVIIFFLVFRFKKAGGIPFLIITGITIAAILLFLQSITAFTGETEIGRIKIITAADNKISCEFIDQENNITPYSMEGTFIGAETKIIVFNDFYVFMGQKTWYRFVGLKTAYIPAGSEMTRELQVYEFEHPSGISEMLYQFVSANSDIIPGIKSTMVQISYVPAKSLTTYAVRIQNDSGAEIVPVER